MNFKIATGTLNYHDPIEIVIERASKLGFDGIELATFSFPMEAGKPLILDKQWFGTKESRKNLRRLLDSNNLGVSCFRGMVRDKAAFREAAQQAVEFGTRKLAFDIPYRLIMSGTPHKEMISEIRRYAEEAEGMDLILAWEVHGVPEMHHKPHDVLRIFNDVGSPSFKCQVDFMHTMRNCSGVLQSPPLDIVGGEWGKLPAIFIKMLGKHVGDVHVSDAIVNWTVGRGRTRFGEGLIDFDEALKALIDIGYKDWLTLDIHTIPGDIWEITEDSKKFLDKLLKKFQ